MLTADLIRPRLRTRAGNISIDLLEPTASARRTAADLIALFQAQIGRTAQDWENALDATIGVRLDYLVMRGLAKVLEDAATFTPLATPIAPDDLRQKLFARGPVFERADLFHPHNRADLLQTLADELGMNADQIEAALYSDRPAAHLLTAVGADWTPDTLIARYNLELARGVLYWAAQMDIDLHDGYKDFWRYLKLFKLMFWATPHPEGGYHVTLDGPISPFVKATTRYGRQFAAFLPAVLLGEKWHMTADIRLPQSKGNLTYTLDPGAPLQTHFKRSGEFDSRLEADFAAEFEAKFGGERGQWTLTREDEVLLLGDTVMIPDFALTHKQDGRRALVEIVGFWHPEYLNRKLAKVRAANRRNLILLVYEGVNLTQDRLINVPGEVLYFPNKPVLKDVLAAVERVAEVEA